MRVASYIGHSAGEIYELAEAADEVDGNKGILGRNHMPEQGSVLSWGTAPSSMAARRWPRSPDIWPRQQFQQDEGRVEKSPRVVGVKEKMTIFGWSRASLLSTAVFARWTHLLPPRDGVCRVPAGQPGVQHTCPI